MMAADSHRRSMALLYREWQLPQRSNLSRGQPSAARTSSSKESGSWRRAEATQ
jgi:hypothetical protein